jgi:hypothetical protein
LSHLGVEGPEVGTTAVIAKAQIAIEDEAGPQRGKVSTNAGNLADHSAPHFEKNRTRSPYLEN